MDQKPNNIAIWCMHRSGSTHFGQRVAFSMEHIYGKPPYVVNLGEATGASGIVTTKLGGSGIWNELQDQISIGSEFFTRHIRWELDENNFLRTKDYYGSVNAEITRREEILKQSTWSNHLVFRNMRWPKMAEASARYDNAIVQGDFSHIVLWRKDLFAWICSRMVFRMTGTPHGENLEYDGIEYMFHSDEAKKEFLMRLQKYVTEFRNSLRLLPVDKTVIVETSAMNDANKIVWPNGINLDLVDHATVKRGMTVWKSTSTGERVLPPDMIDEGEKEILREWAERVEQELDWNNLVQQFGFKTV